jgi:hypothetical protein
MNFDVSAVHSALSEFRRASTVRNFTRFSTERPNSRLTITAEQAI